MGLKSYPFTSLSYDIFRKIIFNVYAYTPEPEEYDEPLLLLDVASPPILASHVCRSWRLALLSDPIMWTCLLIPKMKPSGIAELLRRSGSALLDVFLKLKAHPSYEMDYDKMSKMFSMVFQKIHRFRILYMQVDPRFGEVRFEPDFLQTLLVRQSVSHLTQPAPNLQMFFFWSRDLHETFLDTLFSGNAPNLKRIHHRFFASLKEISCPLFHDLSELHFSIPDESTMDFGLFLDFLKLSPRIQFLRVYVNVYDVSTFSDLSPARRVNLSSLQTLVLEVNRTIEFLDLISENVTFPSSVKRQIISQYLPESVDSLQTLDWMSEVHFTSLHLRIAHGEAVRLSLGENTSSRYINRFNDNKIVYLSEDMTDLMELWYSFVESLEESSEINITSLDIYVEFGYLAEMELFGCQVFPEIIAAASSIVSLTIRHKHKPFFHNDEPSLSFLSELIPDDLPALEPTSEYNRNTNTVILDHRNLAQNLRRLVLVDPEEELASINLTNAITSAPSICPCPHLRELYVELEGTLTETDVATLRTCARRRREEGHPLRIFVRCVRVRGVESMLRLQEDGDISVSVVPVAIE